MITPEQLEQLQAMVAQLAIDNQDANDKTQESHQKDTEATAAALAASQAKSDTVAANSVVAADVTGLQAFVLTLGMPPAPPAE